MKFFTTAGPINPNDHYFVPNRLNEQEILQLIGEKKYFILHAPRQSGKTTAILELVKKLNQEGTYNAFYINVEAAQAARSKVIDGMRTILNNFKINIDLTFGAQDPAYSYLQREVVSDNLSGGVLQEFLQFWAQHSTKPLVLFIDEIDSLVGDTLISVLRQLRTGYTNRPHAFPQAICLFGVRDVRDYRIWSDAEQKTILGGSAFNIKSESLTLANFTLEQVRDLYMQHTAQTGQVFTDEAIDYAFYLTQGQPWLVNALAYQACFRDVQDRSLSITKAVIERSKEVLIKRRDTHIDALVARLNEERVRNIIDAILSGNDKQNFPDDDVLYVEDLGLKKKGSYEIANPIYQEIIPRELTWVRQEAITINRAWYIRQDGLLDIPKFLENFGQFFREGADHWLEDFNYKESGPQLILMAYLQRVINGGGGIHREYALGRRRMDLYVTWPVVEPKQRIVIELKIWQGPKSVQEALEQTAEYMATCNATEGHAIIFDRATTKSWDEKIYCRQEIYGGKVITVWGM